MSEHIDDKRVWKLAPPNRPREVRRWPNATLTSFNPARALAQDPDRPALRHRWRAVMQLRVAVWEAVQPGADLPQLDALPIDALVSDAALRAQFRAAFDEAAIRTGLGSAEAVAAGLHALAGELAVLEQLRERLVTRMQAVLRGLAVNGLAAGRSGRLAVAILNQMQERFAAADELCRNILAGLTDIDRLRMCIRAHCLEITSVAEGWAGPMADAEKALQML